MCGLDYPLYQMCLNSIVLTFLFPQFFFSSQLQLDITTPAVNWKHRTRIRSTFKNLGTCVHCMAATPHIMRRKVRRQNVTDGIMCIIGKLEQEVESYTISFGIFIKYEHFHLIS